MSYTVNQIYGVVNQVAKQTWGESAIEVTDLTGIISIGDKILNSDDDKELFMNSLINRIGKTIITNRPYQGALRNVVRDTMEYGSIVQKIYVEPFEAEANTSWNLKTGEEMTFGTITPPKAQQFLFEVKDVYQFTVTIPDYQINTAFTSAESLGAFISAVYTSMETSINLSLDNMINLCIANFMGEKLLHQETGKGIHALNLLEMYKTATGDESLTPNTALYSMDFLKFAGRTIKLHIQRMQNFSQIYNIKELKRHTPISDLNVFLLTEYASANATYLQADTFNKELVALPNYSEVSFWQGTGETTSFEDVSSINITTSSGKDINQAYIIGFICDKEALGVMYNRRSSKADYVSRYEVTQKYEKVDMGYFNDLSENAIVFYMA